MLEQLGARLAVDEQALGAGYPTAVRVIGPIEPSADPAGR
jgi:hypothetical protein